MSAPRSNSFAVVGFVLSIFTVCTWCVPGIGMIAAGFSLLFVIAGLIVALSRDGAGLGFVVAGGIIAGVTCWLNWKATQVTLAALDTASTALEEVSKSLPPAAPRVVMPLAEPLLAETPSSVKVPLAEPPAPLAILEPEPVPLEVESARLVKNSKPKPLPPPLDPEQVASARLKFARILLDDGKSGIAAIRLEGLIKDFPKTKAAAEAQTLLGSLKR